MQRFLTSILLACAFMLTSCASVSQRIEQSQQHVANPAAVVPQKPPVSSPAAQTSPYVFPPAGAVALPDNMAPKSATGQMGLLLPLKSAAFGRAADAVKQGFMTAFGLQPNNRGSSVKIYATDDQPDSILDAYKLAIQEGSQIVIGPLTRNGVANIAGSGLVTVPTLALNIPENDTATPPNLYFFGLSVEGEARQVARMAFDEGKRTAVTVAAKTPLAKRSQQAFTEEWKNLGGRLVAQYYVTDDASSFPILGETVAKASPDMIFLAADYAKARLVHPYLGVTIPTYSTSQINSGKNEPGKDIDLNGIQFVDMPWLLQPDHPAVMIYPHQEKFFSADYERLYALGIDAYRLADILLTSPNRNITLDGVTGKITLSGDNQVMRELTPGVFRQGIATLLSAGQ